jgi:hypothetical protein
MILFTARERGRPVQRPFITLRARCSVPDTNKAPRLSLPLLRVGLIWSDITGADVGVIE